MWFIALSVIISIIVLVFILIGAIGFYKRLFSVKCKSNKTLNGKTVLVTGGTAGMGLELATEFARRNARVIIACPFEEEGVNSRELITTNTGNEQVVFKLLDLASMTSIREFAEDFLKTEDRLHILINNAGVLAPDNLTEDGFNFIVQVNYLGHFLLTLLLLPLLERSGDPTEPSRIVNTSSLSHSLGRINLEDLTRTGLGLKTYANSKLCVTMLTRELSKRLTSSVVVNTADPGIAVTNISQSFGKHMSVFKFFFGKIYPTAWDGAQTALYLALDDEIDKTSGEYFSNCKLSEAASSAYNDEACLELWEESLKLVNLNSDDWKLQRPPRKGLRS